MKKNEKSELTKTKIIETAIKLFGENSYEGTSIKQIAQTLGISQGLMYNYFESKEQLLVQIFELAKNEIIESFTAKSEKGQPLTLEMYLDNIAEITNTNKNLWRLIHSVKFNNSITKLLETQINELNIYILQSLKQIILINRPDCNLNELRIYFAAIDGLVGHSLVLPDYNLKAEFKELIKIIRS